MFTKPVFLKFVLLIKFYNSSFQDKRPSDSYVFKLVPKGPSVSKPKRRRFSRYIPFTISTSFFKGNGFFCLGVFGYYRFTFFNTFKDLNGKLFFYISPSVGWPSGLRRRTVNPFFHRFESYLHHSI